MRVHEKEKRLKKKHVRKKASLEVFQTELVLCNDLSPLDPVSVIKRLETLGSFKKNYYIHIFVGKKCV